MPRRCSRRGLWSDRAAATALAALVGMLAWGAPDGARATGHYGYPCRDVVDGKLTEAGVGPDEVRDITVVPQRSGGEAKQVIGYNTWVALKACKGSLVVSLTTQCHVRQTYTHGDCRIEGIKH